MTTPPPTPSSADLSDTARPARAGAHSSAWHPRADRLIPWSISILIHAVLIVLGFVIVWTVNPPPPAERPEIIVSFDNPAPAPLITPAPANPLDPSPAAPEPIPDLPPPTLSDTVALLAPTSALPDHDAARADEREMILDRRVPEVRFAGLGVSNAADIIYIVDASGSMVSTLPIALEHLRRSVSQLARTQRFQILFFGKEEVIAAPHPGDSQDGIPTIRLIRATPGNVSAVLDWTKTVFPGGRSHPVAAIKRALWLKPDAIFILGNVITGLGQWEETQEELLAEIDRLNPIDPRNGRRHTVIKTLQFLEEDPTGTLQAIGEAHGGDDGYRFIPRSEVPAP